MPSLGETLSLAQETLQAQGEENPFVAARFLLSALFDLSASDFVLQAERILDEEDLATLAVALSRRAQGEPLQYIVARAPFRRLELIVRPGVLIPRPETELLVDIVKDHCAGAPAEACREASDVRVLDLCTGSACIALALLDECPGLEIVATDISEDALLVAQENAVLLGHGDDARLRILQDDLASSLVGNQTCQHAFDVVVSNPPYIPAGELRELPHEVANYEPLEALDGGVDGLIFFRRITEQATVLLKPGGLMVCELHEAKVEDAMSFLQDSHQWTRIDCHKDLAGRPRFVTALLCAEEGMARAPEGDCRQEVIADKEQHVRRGTLPLQSQIAEASAALRRGEAVIVPTDTVYGIGIAVTADASPEIIYQLKGRDRSKPLPWLVADSTALEKYGDRLPTYALELAKRFWPGALTLIVAASEAVPPAFRASDNTIALRVPDNQIALALIKALGAPLATTSANLQGQPPAHSLDAIDQELLQAQMAMVDGGLTARALPSTIVSCLEEKPVIVRQGALSAQDIESVIS